eukprot:TRINITY_DN26242_c0_g1_i2.p1 TRINITY_DN26242_c0_g1~~TRINITY_DN26242_c0_g1_i2.p1  ORF type:complete len:896 (-),score=210.89 TRINITY_DN26242_c0_g1_i2:69-2756(-)
MSGRRIRVPAPVRSSLAEYTDEALAATEEAQQSDALTAAADSRRHGGQYAAAIESQEEPGGQRKTSTPSPRRAGRVSAPLRAPAPPGGAGVGVPSEELLAAVDSSDIGSQPLAGETPSVCSPGGDISFELDPANWPDVSSMTSSYGSRSALAPKFSDADGVFQQTLGNSMGPSAAAAVNSSASSRLSEQLTAGRPQRSEGGIALGALRRAARGAWPEESASASPGSMSPYFAEEASPGAASKPNFHEHEMDVFAGAASSQEAVAVWATAATSHKQQRSPETASFADHLNESLNSPGDKAEIDTLLEFFVAHQLNWSHVVDTAREMLDGGRGSHSQAKRLMGALAEAASRQDLSRLSDALEDCVEDAIVWSLLWRAAREEALFADSIQQEGTAGSSRHPLSANSSRQLFSRSMDSVSDGPDALLVILNRHGISWTQVVDVAFQSKEICNASGSTRSLLIDIEAAADEAADDDLLEELLEAAFSDDVAWGSLWQAAREILATEGPSAWYGDSVFSLTDCTVQNTESVLSPAVSLTQLPLAESPPSLLERSVGDELPLGESTYSVFGGPSVSSATSPSKQRSRAAAAAHVGGGLRSQRQPADEDDAMCESSTSSETRSGDDAPRMTSAGSRPKALAATANASANAAATPLLARGAFGSAAGASRRSPEASATAKAVKKAAGTGRPEAAAKKGAVTGKVASQQVPTGLTVANVKNHQQGLSKHTNAGHPAMAGLKAAAAAAAAKRQPAAQPGSFSQPADEESLQVECDVLRLEGQQLQLQIKAARQELTRRQKLVDGIGSLEKDCQRAEELGREAALQDQRRRSLESHKKEEHERLAARELPAMTELLSSLHLVLERYRTRVLAPPRREATSKDQIIVQRFLDEVSSEIPSEEDGTYLI